MSRTMKHSTLPRARPWAALLALVAGCTSTPMPPMEPAPGPAAPAPAPQPAPAPPAPAPGVAMRRDSAATTPRAYRQDAATHLYGLNRERIWQGRLPPNLHAIGVLNVNIDRSGNVRGLDWLRAPRHAPEVIAEIERTVRAAAPFPAPVRLGSRGVVYTDVWLWHASGRFQLDTLTEGQD